MFFRFYGMGPGMSRLLKFKGILLQKYKVASTSVEPISLSVNPSLPGGFNMQLNVEFETPEEEARFRKSATMRAVYAVTATKYKGLKVTVQKPGSAAFKVG